MFENDIQQIAFRFFFVYFFSFFFFFFLNKNERPHRNMKCQRHWEHSSQSDFRSLHVAETKNSVDHRRTCQGFPFFFPTFLQRNLSRWTTLAFVCFFWVFARLPRAIAMLEQNWNAVKSPTADDSTRNSIC